MTGWDTPYPHAFEWEYFPGPDRIAAALARVMESHMSRYVFKLPDLGEGAVDAEIVAWKVAAGQEVREDQPLVEMLTQKATWKCPRR